MSARRPLPPSPGIGLAALSARAASAAAAWDDVAILPLLKQAVATQPRDAPRWQLLGLAHRNLDEHAEALHAFGHATALAPDDPLIAHAAARTALEAGLPAVAPFERALALAPLDAPVILGLTAARFAQTGPSAAIAFLADQLRRHPAWYEGHATLARLRWMAGDRADNAASIEQALIERPRDGLLWREYATLALRVGDVARSDAILSRARSALGASRTLDLIEAAGRSEAGEIAAADAIFARDPPTDGAYLAYYARYLLRAGRPAEVAAVLDGKVADDPTRELLPLAALAWRMVGDARYDALMHGTDFVRVYDLADEIGPMDALADCLRALHLASHAPLDQSLREGTQTDGPLFSRLDPPIRALRAVILRAVGRHVDALPPPVAGHPLLGARRQPIRFAGSWSVRLTDRGHHVEHVHPAGWISSAFYVAVPEAGQAGDRAGWLTLGDAPALGVPLPPIAEIEPKPGRLVLFPSFLWHRTRAFPAGERLTVAFDIARPPR